MRPAYWTSRPLKETGPARNRCPALGSEAFADEGAGGNGQERRIVRWVEPTDRCARRFGAHAPLEDDRVQPPLRESRGEEVDVACPLGEHQAVAATAECLDDVSEDLCIPCRMLGERAIDASDSPRDGSRLGPRRRKRWGGRTARGGAGGPGALEGPGVRWVEVWRTGPSWRPMRSSSRSRRYGVAVSPTSSEPGCADRDSNAAAGTWWHSSTIPGRRRPLSARSLRRQVSAKVTISTVPVLFRPPPSCPAFVPRRSGIWRRH